jgi:hypothetical protein
MEVYVERWVKPEGTEYPWSVWADGDQLYSSHGGPKYTSPDDSEIEALAFCAQQIKREPDRIIRL